MNQKTVRAHCAIFFSVLIALDMLYLHKYFISSDCDRDQYVLPGYHRMTNVNQPISQMSPIVSYKSTPYHSYV